MRLLNRYGRIYQTFFHLILTGILRLFCDTIIIFRYNRS